MWTLDRNGQAFECGAGHHASRGSTNQAAEKRRRPMPIGSRAIGERTRARQHERGILELRRRRQQRLASTGMTDSSCVERESSPVCVTVTVHRVLGTVTLSPSCRLFRFVPVAALIS